MAIPSNSNQWPTYYRDKAEKLIGEKCPDGYEVVMEEEVVTGQVTHIESRTKTKEAPSLGPRQDRLRLARSREQRGVLWRVSRFRWARSKRTSTPPRAVGT